MPTGIAVHDPDQKQGNVMNNNPNRGNSLAAEVVVPSLENRKETR
jgi:hypothetical protein